jgi:multidrug efflux pump
VQAQNVVRPAGILNTSRERLFLRVSGAFDSERDIEAVNLFLRDRIIRLGDIATVRRAYVDPPQPMFRVNSKPAIGLAIAMRDQGDILALGRNIKAQTADITANLPYGIEPTLVADRAVTVDHAIADFMSSLWQAILIILACSFLSLGVRPGAVVALSIPLTLAIVFMVMDAVNIDLHRVSLGALIIALTFLVDDAMTTVDAMITRLAAGDTKDQAATFAYRTLAAPMLIGTLVSIWSFVPIGFAKSSAGEYTFSIFAVVAIALIASWFGAVIFSPLVGKAILKAPKPRAAPARPGRVLGLYTGLLRAAIHAKWVTIALALGAFVVSMLLLSFVPRQFFPPSDRPELTVDLTLRQDASIFATEAEVERLEQWLQRDPDVDHFSSYVGRGAIRFILTLKCSARRSLLRPIDRGRQGPGGARSSAAEARGGAGRAIS